MVDISRLKDIEKKLSKHVEKEGQGRMTEKDLRDKMDHHSMKAFNLLRSTDPEYSPEAVHFSQKKKNNLEKAADAHMDIAVKNEHMADTLAEGKRLVDQYRQGYANVHDKLARKTPTHKD